MDTPRSLTQAQDFNVCIAGGEFHFWALDPIFRWFLLIHLMLFKVKSLQSLLLKRQLEEASNILGSEPDSKIWRICLDQPFENWHQKLLSIVVILKRKSGLMWSLVTPFKYQLKFLQFVFSASSLTAMQVTRVCVNWTQSFPSLLCFEIDKFYPSAMYKSCNESWPYQGLNTQLIKLFGIHNFFMFILCNFSSSRWISKLRHVLSWACTNSILPH